MHDGRYDIAWFLMCYDACGTPRCDLCEWAPSPAPAFAGPVLGAHASGGVPPHPGPPPTAQSAPPDGQEWDAEC